MSGARGSGVAHDGAEGATHNVRLTVAYDGTDFCGWQRQKSERTVQQVVEEALQRMLGAPVRGHARGARPV